MAKKPVIKDGTVKEIEKKSSEKKVSMKDKETSEYFKTIICAVIVIVLIVSGYFIYQYKNKKDNENIKNKQETKITLTEDEKKFKKEYEDLNDKYDKVEIADDNNIKYISLSESIKILKEGTGVIYFGTPKENDSRNSVPKLLKAMESTNLEEIYYVDITNVRDEYEPNSRGTSGVQSKKADQEYYDLLELLKKYLPDYKLETSLGKIITINEKRLVGPTVVTVRDGKIFECLAGTLIGDAFVRRYTDMISNYLADSCPVESTGDC